MDPVLGEKALTMDEKVENDTSSDVVSVADAATIYIDSEKEKETL
jgi:hypothetical protein